MVLEDVDASQVPIVPKANKFYYNERYWCVSENFEFPIDTKRLYGWQLWLCGRIVVSSNIPYKLKSCCVLKGKDLHSKSVKHELALKWKSLFRMMKMCTV